MEKTNVMRTLDQKHIPYKTHTYDSSVTDGVSVAELIGESAERVFKTLVTAANTGEHLVFVIPVTDSLDLKKAAKAAGVKSAAMLKQKELLPLTGYVHGGCSPIGMKKQFRTFVDETARLFDALIVSAGKIGFQVEIDPDSLAVLTGAEFAGVTVY